MMEECSDILETLECGTTSGPLNDDDPPTSPQRRSSIVERLGVFIESKDLEEMEPYEFSSYYYSPSSPESSSSSTRRQVPSERLNIGGAAGDAEVADSDDVEEHKSLRTFKKKARELLNGTATESPFQPFIWLNQLENFISNDGESLISTFTSFCAPTDPHGFRNISNIVYHTTVKNGFQLSYSDSAFPERSKKGMSISDIWSNGFHDYHDWLRSRCDALDTEYHTLLRLTFDRMPAYKLPMVEAVQGQDFINDTIVTIHKGHTPLLFSGFRLFPNLKFDEYGESLKSLDESEVRECYNQRCRPDLVEAMEYLSTSKVHFDLLWGYNSNPSYEVRYGVHDVQLQHAVFIEMLSKCLEFLAVSDFKLGTPPKNVPVRTYIGQMAMDPKLIFGKSEATTSSETTTAGSSFDDNDNDDTTTTVPDGASGPHLNAIFYISTTDADEVETRSDGTLTPDNEDEDTVSSVFSQQSVVREEGGGRDGEESISNAASEYTVGSSSNQSSVNSPPPNFIVYSPPASSASNSIQLSLPEREPSQIQFGVDVAEHGEHALGQHSLTQLNFEGVFAFLRNEANDKNDADDGGIGRNAVLSDSDDDNDEPEIRRPRLE